MSNVIEAMEKDLMKKQVPDFRVGDTVKVHVKVKEGDKERVQAFEGVVIASHSGRNRTTFTVRKVSGGVGVERVFPVHSPAVSRIDVLRRNRVNRSKLYYLRDLRGKAARLKEKRNPAEV